MPPHRRHLSGLLIQQKDDYPSLGPDHLVDYQVQGVLEDLLQIRRTAFSSGEAAKRGKGHDPLLILIGCRHLPPEGEQQMNNIDYRRLPAGAGLS
jgi:hypothetical protein